MSDAEIIVLIMLGAIIVPFSLYILIRLGALAFYRSKTQVEKKET
jgi:hypothetical protein